MSLNDTTERDWDNLKSDRYFDNRDPKEAECLLVRPDPVNSPTHYTHGGDIECIDAIDAMLGHELSLAYYQASAVKYLWRWKYKGGLESLRKCKWFVERMIQTELKGG